MRIRLSLRAVIRPQTQTPLSNKRRPLYLELLESRDLLAVFTPDYLLHSTGSATPFASAGPTGTTPTQIENAYGINQIKMPNGSPADGTGTTIAIVDAYDDPQIGSDLQMFDAKFNLPNPVFNKVNQTGGSTYPTANAGWSDEISLDVEWAHAIAPEAHILLVEASSASDANLFAAVSYAARQTGVVAVSMSWGGSEFSGEKSDDSDLVTPSGHPGVAFVTSSGDAGAPVSYPAASPNVLSVGGTTLQFTAQNTIATETGWADSGGGLSAVEAEPSYQKGVVTQTTTARANPDVSYDADPNTGFPVYITYGNSASTPWLQFGGTSDAAPQWAALIAIADQGRAEAGLASLSSTTLLPLIYQLPSADFNDVTSGKSVGSPKYSAGVGYDLVTGRGTPVANLVVAGLIGTTGPITPVATHFQISAPTSTTAGGAMTVTVTALDSSNDVVKGYTGTVAFTSTDGAAVLPANYLFTSGDAGSHAFTVTLDTAGSQTITVADTSNSSLTTTSSAISVSAGQATHLAFGQQPTVGSAGAVLSPVVTVRVLDAFNNLVTTGNPQISLTLGTNPSSGTLGGTTTATASNGIATFSNLTINNVGSGYTLVAGAPGLTSMISAAVTITAAPAPGSSTLIEGFEGTSTYTIVGANSPSASVTTAAAHDGSYGLDDSNGNDWLYRNDAAAQVTTGEAISVWVKLAGVADGRAYFGFGASASGTLSAVLAPNTNQLLIQSNAGYGFTDLASVTQSFAANHWYRVQVDWGSGGTITVGLYDTNGTTLLNQVSTTNTSITAGGIAFRATGHDKYWDTVTVTPIVSASISSPTFTSPKTNPTSAVVPSTTSEPPLRRVIDSLFAATVESLPGAREPALGAYESAWLESLFEI